MKSAVDTKVLDAHASRKKYVRDCPIWYTKIYTRQCSAESKYRLSAEFLNIKFSGHCWIWDCAADVPLMPLLTKDHCQLHLQWAWKHRVWTMDKWKTVIWLEWITIFHAWRQWSCQGTQSSRRTIAPSLYSRSYTGW